MYEILSNLPESVAYTCTSCTERPPAEWRTALEKELQGSVRQVLTALLNSRTSTHLLRYRQVSVLHPLLLFKGVNVLHPLLLYSGEVCPTLYCCKEG